MLFNKFRLRINNKIDSKINDVLEFKITSTLGIVRLFLALSTLTSLCFNKFVFNNKNFANPFTEEFDEKISALSLFRLFENNLLLAKGIAILILILVISGYFIKLTSILHWYVTLSYLYSFEYVNGGDHINSIITFLIIPICFYDKRVNHWNKPLMVIDKTYLNYLLSFLSFFSILMINIQVSFIYFDAFEKKIRFNEWVDGSAMWYFMNDENFGPYGIRKKIIGIFINNSYLLLLSTWSVLILEFFLFSCIFFKYKTRKYFFILGLILHLSIAFFMGLISFALTMFAALTIYCIPLNFDVIKKLKKNLLR